MGIEGSGMKISDPPSTPCCFSLPQPCKKLQLIKCTSILSEISTLSGSLTYYSAVPSEDRVSIWQLGHMLTKESMSSYLWTAGQSEGLVSSGP